MMKTMDRREVRAVFMVRTGQGATEHCTADESLMEQMMMTTMMTTLVDQLDLVSVLGTITQQGGT